MALTQYTQFKGISNIGDSLLNTQLENNIKSWAEWCLLGIGAWSNVNIPASGAFGGDFSKLRPVEDVSYTAGQVWEGVRKDWVYETGVSYKAGQPIAISGVYINSVFYPKNSGSHQHYVNYPLGRIIFNTPISTGSVVKANYSYRWAQVYKADDVAGWQTIQYNSFRPDDIQFTQYGRGEWSVDGEHRIQVPAIIVESVPRSRAIPYEMGNSSFWANQDILITALAETRWERNQILDIFRYQFDKNIKLYDSNAVVAATGFPLDYRGNFPGSGNMYPYLVDTFNWKACRFKDVVISEAQSVNKALFQGIVRMTCEVLMGDT